LADTRLTHTYGLVFGFCEFKNIDYLVLRYLNTGAPPFNEWAEEWLHNREVSSSFMKETGFGGNSILVALAYRCKRLSLRIRQGEKEIVR